MDKITIDKRSRKEYTTGSKLATPSRPYKSETYRKYRANRPRKIDYCQLKGCGRELPRFGIVIHRRFCCDEHAALYQIAYRKEWRAKNQGKVLAAKKRYREKLKKERKNNITTTQSNETSKAKTYLI